MSKSRGRKGGPDDAGYAAAPSDAVFVGVAVSDGGVDRMVLSPRDAAAACGASRAAGYRLWARYRQGGWAALVDRPSTPRGVSRGGCRWSRSAKIVATRERTSAGPVVIAAITGRPASTVGKVLRRWGCSRLPRPERDPVRRYERERPGELIHVDTKKLGRFHVVGKRILNDGVSRSREGRLATSPHRHRRPFPARPTRKSWPAKTSTPAPCFFAARWPGMPSRTSRRGAGLVG